MSKMEKYDPVTVIFEEKEVKGWLDRKKNIFYSESDFIKLLLTDREELLGRIESLLVQADGLRRNIHDKEEKLKNAEKINKQETLEIEKSARDKTLKEVCSWIYDKEGLFRNEPAVYDSWLVYSQVIDGLKEAGLWRS